MTALTETWSQGAWLIFCACLSLLIARRALKKKSLNRSGAVAAFFVGLVTISSHALFGALLLSFFISSSAISKLGSRAKAAVFADFKEGGQRDKWQVLANAAWMLLLAVAWLSRFGITPALAWPVIDTSFASTSDSTASAAGAVLSAFVLLQAAIAHFAACCGDTWASELGTVYASAPRFILPPFHVVPKGTNGGVTSVGTAASAAGGLLIGAVGSVGLLLLPKFAVTTVTGTAAAAAAATLTSAASAGASAGAGASTLVNVASFLGLTATASAPWLAALACVATGAFAGLGGSVVDSVLGAVLQVTVVRGDGKVSDEWPETTNTASAASATRPTTTTTTTAAAAEVTAPVTRKGAGKRAVKAATTATTAKNNSTPHSAVSALDNAARPHEAVVHVSGISVLGNSQVNSLAALAAVAATAALWGVLLLLLLSSSGVGVGLEGALAGALAGLKTAVAPLDLVAVGVACVGVVVAVRHEGDEEREEKARSERKEL